MAAQRFPSIETGSGLLPAADPMKLVGRFGLFAVIRHGSTKQEREESRIEEAGCHLTRQSPVRHSRRSMAPSRPAQPVCVRQSQGHDARRRRHRGDRGAGGADARGRTSERLPAARSQAARGGAERVARLRVRARRGAGRDEARRWSEGPPALRPGLGQERDGSAQPAGAGNRQTLWRGERGVVDMRLPACAVHVVTALRARPSHRCERGL